MGFCLNAAAEATQFSTDHQISGARQEVGQPVGLNSGGFWVSFLVQGEQRCFEPPVTSLPGL